MQNKGPRLVKSFCKHKKYNQFLLLLYLSLKESYFIGVSCTMENIMNPGQSAMDPPEI